MSEQYAAEVREKAVRIAASLWPTGQHPESKTIIEHAQTIAAYLAPTTYEQTVTRAAEKAVARLWDIIRTSTEDTVPRQLVDEIAVELSRALEPPF